MDVLRGSEARPLKQRAEAMPRDDPRAEALLCGGHRPFANRFPLTIPQHMRFTSREFTTALARKFCLVIPQLFTAIGMPLSNNTNSARKVGDAFGHAYTTVTRANGNHVRTFHDAVLAYLFDKAAAIIFRGGPGNSTKTYSHIAFSRTSQTVNIGTSRASSLT
jgi:hypothetical protein